MLRPVRRRSSSLPSAPVGAEGRPSELAVAPASGLPVVASVMTPEILTLGTPGGSAERRRGGGVAFGVCAPSGIAIATRATIAPARMKREGNVIRVSSGFGRFRRGRAAAGYFMVDHAFVVRMRPLLRRYTPPMRAACIIALSTLAAATAPSAMTDTPPTAAAAAHFVTQAEAKEAEVNVEQQHAPWVAENFIH